MPAPAAARWRRLPWSTSVLLALLPAAAGASPHPAGAAASPAGASPAPAPRAPGVLTVLLENDLFYEVDRDYTNGVALFWVPGSGSPPGWAVRIARWIPWIPRDSAARHGFALGQNMYTPADISTPDPPLDDRPYAGWLYGTIGLGFETGRQLDQFALTLGVVGPASLAEQSQKLVHEITGDPEPQGWDTQLANEPGILLTCLHSWRGLAGKSLIGFDFDAAPHLVGALGNVYTYAGAGLTLRYGRNLPLDYGPPRIQPSLPGSGFFSPPRRFAGHLFAGVEGRAVARNIFLDGNTFQDSRSVDKEPFVADAQFGAVLTWRHARLSYTHVVRTPEFETQDGSDQFGALSLSVAF